VKFLSNEPRRVSRSPSVRETPSEKKDDSDLKSRRLWSALAVTFLLALHLAMAERSLIQENPTVDEVVHLPAGITYWQKHTFRLYHHNPPLIKMIAALPVVWAKPDMALVYQQPSWTAPDPSPPTFSQTFALANFNRYFELFCLGRMVMPLFSVLGGLAVFAWSRKLYGTGGGLLSLCLWVFCPNILAHVRLITTDLGSTAVGAAATYLFWQYLRNPTWARAAAAGVLLGLAQLTKFSMLLLYAVWPFLWLVQLAWATPRERIYRQLASGVAHGCLVVALSVLVIDTGYLFEGVGIPLGRFEFASGALTRPVAGGIRHAPATKNPAFAMLWPFRENRFRNTLLAGLPVPLPEHYVLGFDEQKIEAEGFPKRLERAFQALRAGDLVRAKQEAGAADNSVAGYPVYLNGELRDSGWWYYYFCALLYKVPEGTWLLVLLSVVLLFSSTRTRESWVDEICLAAVPLVVLFAMSFLTNINLGLRYVLSIFPYVLISVGKVVPWVEGLSGTRRAAARSYIAICLVTTIVATVAISPHYLAYFNWSSGGPDRVPARLIDSNLDWGQDLVALRQWCREHLGDEPIGLAYFGQINPSIFADQGDPFPWFLPPVRPGTTRPMDRDSSLPPLMLIGPAPRLTPGYYAVSRTLVHGLPWRLYDPSPVRQDAWAPAWNAQEHAFSYFQQFTPIERIGHSIDIYKLSQADVDQLNALLELPGRK
jgi:hypothetical protein